MYGQAVLIMSNSTGETTLSPQFIGKLCKIQLISNNDCYGPSPEPEDEVEQHLTIFKDGSVFISRYQYGEGSGYTLHSEELRLISSTSVEKIFDAFTKYFCKDHKVILASDIGCWHLYLTNEKDDLYRESGALCCDLRVGRVGLSSLIRKELNEKRLLLFDGSDPCRMIKQRKVE